MSFNDSIAEALDRVLAWDLPDELAGYALCTEAGHLAGLDSEQLGEGLID